MAAPRTKFPWFFLYFLLCFPSLHGIPSARAQQPPVDAAEISRELLYHPARRIEATPGGWIFRAAQFTYRFDPASSRWEVAREKNFSAAEAGRATIRYTSARLGTEYRFKGVGADEEGTLEIRRGEQPEPVARLGLWERKQLAATWLAFLRQDAPSLTPEALAKDLEIADPEVAGVADDGTYLWLAIRYSAGEGSLGIGTVVRFDPKTNEAKLFQPADLATSSVTHIAAAGSALWLGTHRQGEGAIFVTKGLVRFAPAAGEARSFLPGSSPLAGSIVTALWVQSETLLVATDTGICRILLPEARAEDWTCWRIVPMVRLAAPVPVSNRPGVPPGGRLAAGSYEVRWANAAFFEVATPDWIEGWVAADDWDEYSRRHFDAEPYELGNASLGGPPPIRLLAKPGSDPLAGALVYRAPLERVGSATAEGWQRVRARVGWISRAQLEVVPVIQPIARAPAPAR